MDSRTAALNIFMAMDKGTFYEDALLSVQDKITNPKDRGLTIEIVQGTLRNKLYLEYVLSKFSKIKVNKLHLPVYHVLLMSLYQIHFLDKVPEHAILNEAVELTKKWGNKGSAGFVNGVLRNVIRKKDMAFKISIDDPMKYLSIKYSMPLEWTNYFVTKLGREEAELFFKACIERAPFIIRAKKLHELTEELESLGYEVRKAPLAKNSLIIENPTGIFETKAYREGRFYVQDDASQYVVENFEQERVSQSLDICAAPGGKSFQLAEISDEVLAADKSKSRLRVMRENIERLKIDNIKVIRHNGEKYNPMWDQSFDRVLVDAPCSGMGLLRGKPEIRYHTKQIDSKNLSKIQLKILTNASKAVKLGGELIYSTCTVTYEENEEVIAKFLNQNIDFIAHEPIRLWPHRDQCDGFFIQKLTRKES